MFAIGLSFTLVSIQEGRETCFKDVLLVYWGQELDNISKYTIALIIYKTANNFISQVFGACPQHIL